MVVKELKNCRKFISNDGAILRELFNAGKGDFKFRYSLAHAIVKKGKSTVAHKLRTTELYYIINGMGLMHVDQETSKVKSGSAVYIPPRSVQYA